MVLLLQNRAKLPLFILSPVRVYFSYCIKKRPQPGRVPFMVLLLQNRTKLRIFSFSSVLLILHQKASAARGECQFRRFFFGLIFLLLQHVNQKTTIDSIFIYFFHSLARLPLRSDGVTLLCNSSSRPKYTFTMHVQ